MVTINPRVPFAILIFTNEGQTVYRTYSPANWEVVPETESPDFEIQLGQFIARLYHHIAYDAQNPLNNQTHYGRLQEVHTRNVLMPVSSRGELAYFSTFDHPHCNYRPVHRASPVFFHPMEAANYASAFPGMTHVCASHEIL